MGKRGRRPGDKDLKKAIGESIRKAVGNKRGGQAQLARRLKLDRQKISQYCQGKHRPSDDNLLKICNVLEITDIPYKGVNYLAGISQLKPGLRSVPYQQSLFDQLKNYEENMDIRVGEDDKGRVQLVITIKTTKMSA